MPSPQTLIPVSGRRVVTLTGINIPLERPGGVPENLSDGSDHTGDFATDYGDYDTPPGHIVYAVDYEMTPLDIGDAKINLVSVYIRAEEGSDYPIARAFVMPLLDGVPRGTALDMLRPGFIWYRFDFWTNPATNRSWGTDNFPARIGFHAETIGAGTHDVDASCTELYVQVVYSSRPTELIGILRPRGEVGDGSDATFMRTEYDGAVGGLSVDDFIFHRINGSLGGTIEYLVLSMRTRYAGTWGVGPAVQLQWTTDFSHYGDTVSQSGSIAFATTSSANLATDPTGAAWTVASVNALRFGPRVVGAVAEGATAYWDCADLWIEVWGTVDRVTGRGTIGPRHRVGAIGPKRHSGRIGAKARSGIVELA